MLEPVTLNQAFSGSECARIIGLAQSEGLAAAGLVLGQSDTAIRSAQVAWLDDGGAADWVMQRVVDLVTEANRAFGFDLADFAERMQVACYRASQHGHFDWHADSGFGPLAVKRKLTLVVQLSDPNDYHGGSLQTWAGNQPAIAMKSQGAATVFPAFALHRVTPVTQGERWSLTTWVHGPAFR